MTATRIPARRMNHAVLFVSNLDRSIQFWTQALELDVAAREEWANAAFLRLDKSGNHHDLGLFEIGDDTPKTHGKTIGLYHLAWQVDTIDELAEARETLIGLGAYTGESSHGATKSVYGVDPDGIEFEIVWLLPHSAWGEFDEAAPVDPLHLKAEVAEWSGVQTAALVANGINDRQADKT